MAMMRLPSRISGALCCAKREREGVGLEAPAPVLELHLHGRLEHPRGRVGDHDVEAIEGLAKAVEHLRDALRVTGTALQRDRGAAERAHLGAQGLRLVVTVVVVDRDIAAGGSELAHARAADAAGAARDERDLAGEGSRHAESFVGGWAAATRAGTAAPRPKRSIIPRGPRETPSGRRVPPRICVASPRRPRAPSSGVGPIGPWLRPPALYVQDETGAVRVTAAEAARPDRAAWYGLGPASMLASP